jgi:hypothetical protein
LADAGRNQTSKLLPASEILLFESRLLDSCKALAAVAWRNGVPSKRIFSTAAWADDKALPPHSGRLLKNFVGFPPARLFNG